MCSKIFDTNNNPLQTKAVLYHTKLEKGKSNIIAQPIVCLLGIDIDGMELVESRQHMPDMTSNFSN